MTKEIIQELKNSGLTGRSGSGFPVWQKWQAVKDAPSNQKYIVCNGSEGEPMVFKDGHILEKYPEELINGVKTALKTIDNSQAYIYLNKDYYARFSQTLKNLSGNMPVILFEEPGGYIAGEETALLNVIEGKRAEPRLKPPYPTQAGLWGKPTLVQNVETFYWISKIAKNEYQGHRFYSIEGDAANKGVFELPETDTVRQILQKTDNYPDFDFFAQIGGGAAGTIMLAKELDQPVKGTGSIVIYDRLRTDVLDLMKAWAEFFVNNNCDKCTPCREGLYRILETIAGGKEKILAEKQSLDELFTALEKTAFCPLGRMAAGPFKSAMAKLL
ncbi:MAG: NADH-ubiquinone oxidoreductase-F iron-sulfur binding region domain-containing protein [Candidatus Pacebacteria bacterium]|nr:NADH-ubiquinone oxidoreductase-F iron-sulfur binding region domain-containing protein [Candidatus Paceibacterota bacterium]